MVHACRGLQKDESRKLKEQEQLVFHERLRPSNFFAFKKALHPERLNLGFH